MGLLNILSADPVNEGDFEDFFENSLCGFISAGADGKIVRANSLLAGWLECEPQDLVGKPFSDLLAIGGKIYYETHLSPLLKMQGFFDEVALELAAKNGERKQVLVNAYEARDKHGAVRLIRYTLFKATDRRLYEQYLREAKTAAENNLSNEREIAKLREQFIAVLGHDLRNPVGAIISGTSLINTAELSERSKRIITMIKDSAARMTELIENILDFARVRLGGGLTLNLQPTLLEPVLMHAIEELRIAHPGRTVETDISLPQPINCDAPRISQLFSNLLANAVTHGSAEQPVRITGKVENSELELSISNSGKKIPATTLEHLFEPFTREEAHASQNGLGLGLYIAAQIARAHKAELTATSTDDETRFIYRMPLKEI